MTGMLRPDAVCLAAFLAVCLLGVFRLFAVFGQLRFGETKPYKAEFANVTGLEDCDFVRVVTFFAVTRAAPEPRVSGGRPR